MAEFEDKLNAILGDPEAMGQIVSIARALTGGSESTDSDPLPTPSVPAESPAGQGADTGQPDWSALLGLLGGGGDKGSPLSALGDLDPRLIQVAMTLFSEYSATDDNKTALLNALRPFLKEERRAKIDQAVKIARLARVIRVAFQLFKGNGEEEVNGDV